MTSNSNQKPTKEHRRHLDRIALSSRRSVGTKRLGFIDQRLPSYVTLRSSCPRFSSVSRPLIVEGHHHPSASARQIRLWPNTSILLHTAIVLSGFRSLLVYPITSSKMSGSDMISPSQIGSDVTQRWVHRSENINQCICGLYIYYVLRSLWTCISGVSGVLRGQDVYLGKNWVLQRANSSQHRRHQEG